MPKRMWKPPAGSDLDAPGLQWRKRETLGIWVPYWVSSKDARKAGYTPKTVRLEAGAEDFDDAELSDIATRCQLHQKEMEDFLGGNTEYLPEYDGTIKSLIELYQIDEESPYQTKSDKTREGYDYNLRILLADEIAKKKVKEITGKQVRQLYKRLRAPAKEGEPERVVRAYSTIRMLRIVVNWGASERLSGVLELAVALSKMEFENAPPRDSYMTIDQALATADKARKDGRPSIARAVLFAFELTLRPKDVVGEWSPLRPGEQGGIVDRGKRWQRGLDWSEIDSDSVLKHKTSKRNKLAQHDLKEYPLLIEELERTPPERRIGPLIIDEGSGLPYRYRTFFGFFRKYARAAGVPDEVWFMDSRAGGITEATDAGADLEHVRHHATHSNIAMTQRYSRGALAKTRAVAKKRQAHRNER